jgi:hypothetical protein
MIHYTDALTRLVHDIVLRVEALKFIDPARLLLFARVGRSSAAGAYATCHCLNLPATEPGYYFWRDRETGLLTRRTDCFVTRTPEVRMGRQRIEYLISFALPRFCDQVLDGSRKASLYPGLAPWVAKLDTVVHELYHIAPDVQGLRTFARADGGTSARSHGPCFFDEVAAFVRTYLDSDPDPARLEFLQHDFAALTLRYGTVTGTTFRNFPSYPQRYQVPVVPQPVLPDVAISPLPQRRQPTCYTERDLRLRAFTADGSRRLHPSELDTAA